jgi:hypothetical protein
LKLTELLKKARLKKSMTYSGYPIRDRIKFQGLDISIENPIASVRRGKSDNGKEWLTIMRYPYGYIRGTQGVDGDHVDCFIGQNENSKNVYVIHQVDPKTKKYDEDKVMLGFNSEEEATNAYLEHYDSNKFLGSITPMSIDEFKDKVLNTRNGKKSLKALLIKAAGKGLVPVKVIARKKGGGTYQMTVWKKVGDIEKDESQVGVGESIADIGGLELSRYSEKAVIIKGKTYENINLLREIKDALGIGSWNAKLKGWVYPYKHVGVIYEKLEAKLEAKIEKKEEQLGILDDVPPPEEIKKETKKTDKVPKLKPDKKKAEKIKKEIDDLEDHKKEAEAVKKSSSLVGAKIQNVDSGKLGTITRIRDFGGGIIGYEIEHDDGSKSLAARDDFKVVPATDDKEISDTINTTTAGTREENTIKIGGEGEDEPKGDYHYIPTTFEKQFNFWNPTFHHTNNRVVTRFSEAFSDVSISVKDYTQVKHDEIILYTEEEFLEKGKPSYIPAIDESSFNRNKKYGKVPLYVFKESDDVYYIASTGFDTRSSRWVYEEAKTTGITENFEMFKVSRDVLAATYHYYDNLEKAKKDAKYREKTKTYIDFLNSEQGWNAPEYLRGKEKIQIPYNATKSQVKKLIKEKLGMSASLRQWPVKKRDKKHSTERGNLVTTTPHLSHIASHMGPPGEGDALNQYITDMWGNYKETMKELDIAMNDLLLQREADSEQYKKGFETSYGEANTSDVIMDTHGVKVKRQNGDNIMPKEVGQIKDALNSIYSVFGNRSNLAKSTNLKVSHSGEKLMYARKALGLFVPRENTIAATAKGGPKSFGVTMAHEFAHFMDFQIGKKENRNYISGNPRDTAGKIAGKFRDLMGHSSNPSEAIITGEVKDKSESKYDNRTCECFARALEQYYVHETQGKSGEESYNIRAIKRKDVVHPEVFNGVIAPLIKQLLKEKASVLKAAIKKIAMQKAAYRGKKGYIRTGTPGNYKYKKIKPKAESKPKEPQKKQGVAHDEIIAQRKPQDHVVHSKEFKSWFGNWSGGEGSKVLNNAGEPAENYHMSKVVGEGGKPIAAYHGTAKGGFDEFKKDKTDPNALYGAGFYFTEDLGIAKEYSVKKIDSTVIPKFHNDAELVKEPEVKEVYLNIRKPFDIDNDVIHVKDLPKADVKKATERLDSYAKAFPANQDIQLAKERFSSGKLDYEDAAFILHGNDKNEMNKALQKAGYDGLTHIGGKNIGTRDHKVWIAFEPNQIKATTAKEFDSKSNNIYKAAIRYINQKRSKV